MSYSRHEARGDFSIDSGTRLNHNIRAVNLRVIDEDGQQLGVLSLGDALRAAEERGLDLVEVSAGAHPPVAKIVDWGKYNYQRTKQAQKSKRGSRSPDVKQMRFGLKISQHDLDVKLRKVRQFLEEGHKVKLIVVFRGREMAHQELGFKLTEGLTAKLADWALVDQPPQQAGRQLSMVIRRRQVQSKKPDDKQVPASSVAQNNAAGLAVAVK